LNQRLDLRRREFEAELFERSDRFGGVPDETVSKILVCDDAADDELNGFLRHVAGPRQEEWQLPRQSRTMRQNGRIT
jgi:hypothetical protein